MQQTFDTLYEKGKQIVITSDRLPEEIPKITDALASRFKRGLMVEITPPDFKTRLEIIKKLAGNNDIKAEIEALEYIAKHFTNNVREHEGAFTKVCAYAEFNNKPITLELAKYILKCDENEKQITFENITDVTSKYYDVDIKDILGTARSQKIALARQISIYICRELTSQSFEAIGEYFNRKHTTTMYAYEQTKNKIDIKKDIASAVREIKQALKVL